MISITARSLKERTDAGQADARHRNKKKKQT